MGSSSTNHDWDAVFRALSSERRRIVLGQLERGSGYADVRSLARGIAFERTDSGSRDPDPEVITRNVVSLYHADLPVLADAGLVRLDERSGIVWLNEEITLPLLDTLNGGDGSISPQ